MVDKRCKKCPWYDAEWICTCPSNEPWQCPLDKEANDALDKWADEVNRRVSE